MGELLVSTFEDLADHTMVLSEDKTFTASIAYGVSTEPPFPSSAKEAFSQSLAQEGDEVCTLQVIKPSSQEDSRNTISDGDEGPMREMGLTSMFKSPLFSQHLPFSNVRCPL